MYTISLKYNGQDFSQSGDNIAELFDLCIQEPPITEGFLMATDGTVVVERRLSLPQLRKLRNDLEARNAFIIAILPQHG